MRIYLGTHETSWLGRTDVPLFISRRRLAKRKRLPTAIGRWALDSGGFTELAMFAGWQTSKEQYAEEVVCYQEEIRNMDFASIQDWMCEPVMIERTGLSVRGHQERTVQSLIDLQALAPGVPWCPVIQGFSVDEYLECVELYGSAGIDLSQFDRVGVGSVCRRQATREAVDIFSALRVFGLKLHGFGLKAGFIKTAVACKVESSDSLSWSKQARSQGIRLPGCTHKKCSNCIRWATQWYGELVERASRPAQELLFF